MTWELIVPIGRVMPLATSPHRFNQIAGPRGTVVRNASEAADICARFGGRAAKPQGPVVLVAADGRTPIIIVTDGLVEASEMEDIAIAAAERSAERVRKTGTTMPFAEYRARRGLPEAKDVPAMFGNALNDRMAKHRANPRTDPARVPQQPI